MLISFEQVSFSYETSKTNDPSSCNEVFALRDITTSISSDEIVGIIGVTGSGKSTFVRHLNGLLSPTQGHIFFDKSDYSNKTTSQKVRSAVGMLFQYSEQQLFGSSVYEDIAFGPRNFGCSEDEVKHRVKQALDQVDLDFDSYARKNPFELSGGQQRRVALAGVLACKPHFLVLDEPTAGLDAQSQRSLKRLIRKLHEDGIGIVFVSHFMDDVAELSNRVIALDHGRIIAEGTPEEVFSAFDALQEAGIEVPKAQNLAHNLRKRGFELPKTYYSEQELLAALTSLIQSHTN